MSNTNDSTQPLLSILCLTYNHENYINKTIESFLNQKTSFNFEIIIGEDCSTDRTRSLVESYKDKFPNKIKIISSASNVGVTENLRRSLAACLGKYIAFCEGDDYWDDFNKLQIQVDFLEKNKNYVITYHDTHSIDENGEIKDRKEIKGLQTDASNIQLKKTVPISTLTTCFRNVITEIPEEFNSSPMLDLCLWSLLGHYGAGKFIKEIKPSRYRIHSGGIFSQKSMSQKYRMTAQTHLCLANYYENKKEYKLSQFFFFKAAISSSLPLSAPKTLILIINSIFILIKKLIKTIIRKNSAR
jgi:glycosyltransferase involved in cell wall biosynthesis